MRGKSCHNLFLAATALRFSGRVMNTVPICEIMERRSLCCLKRAETAPAGPQDKDDASAAIPDMLTGLKADGSGLSLHQAATQGFLLQRAA